MKKLFAVMIVVIAMFGLSSSGQCSLGPYERMTHICHKPRVTDYLKFKIEVTDFINQANTIPDQEMGFAYIFNNLKKLQQENCYLFLFSMKMVPKPYIEKDPDNDNPLAYMINIWYGSHDIQSAWRLHIGTNIFGLITWMEEFPENKQLPK